MVLRSSIREDTVNHDFGAINAPSGTSAQRVQVDGLLTELTPEAKKGMRPALLVLPAVPVAAL